MILKNLTRKTTVSKDLKIASSLIDKTLGLLVRNNPRSLLFKTRFGIHTFGLKNSIDVIIVDQKNIVRLKTTILPNKIFIYNPKYDTVIELPEGLIEKSKTRYGDKLMIKG